MPFVKLDTGILDSSLWSEPAQTCKCWITLLAMADSTGAVHSTAPGIARRANLGLADTEKALEVFESPDGHSRSLNEEGRRIKRVDGGYQIVNYEKYRERDYTAAERQKRWRDKQKSNAVTTVTRNVTSRKQKQSTEAEVPKHLNDVLVYAKEIGLIQIEAEKFFDFFTSNGWKVSGRAPMRDWKASLRNWKRNAKNAPKTERKQPAPTGEAYKIIPAAREISDEELEKSREIAKREVEKLKANLR